MVTKKTCNILLVFVTLAVIFIITICIGNQRQMRVAQNIDRSVIRIAAQSSINASNTMNPILALQEVDKAIAYIEMLHTRWGVDKSLLLTNVDTVKMLTMLHTQQSAIIKKIDMKWPMYKVEHPLGGSAGYSPPSQYPDQEVTVMDSDDDVDIVD